MIWVEKYKILFAHIPKSGGSAWLRAWMPHISGEEPDYTEKGWQIPFHLDGKIHPRFGRFESHLKCFEQCQEFVAIIRPPWSRICSLYRKVKPSTDLVTFAKDGKFQNGMHFRSIPYLTDLKCTMWLRYSHLQEDNNTLCDKHGIPRVDMSKRANHTPDQRSDEELCSLKFLQWCWNKYSNEIEYFGWEDDYRRLLSRAELSAV